MDQTPLSYLDTEAPPVALTFTYEPDEFTRFGIWSLSRQWWGFVLGFLVIASLDVLVRMGEPDPDWLMVPWKSAFITVVIAGVFVYSTVVRGRQIWKTTAYVRETVQAVVTPSTLHWQGKGMTTTLELATLHAATETRTHFALFLNSVSAYLIPKRALQSPDDLARLRSYLRAGLPGTARVTLLG